MSSAQPADGAVPSRDADAPLLGRRGGAALFWLLLAVVAVEAAMFLVAAGRGLDLTDESYYLLKYRYWTEWPTVSLFGAYFSVPYSLFGHDVWAMRALGFVLLLSASAWFGHEAIVAFDAVARRTSRAALPAVAVASSAGLWNYYGAWPVPYTPSYNLLTLLSALLALALALRLGRAVLRGGPGVAATAFLLGLVGSVAIASKFSSGVLVIGLSLAVVVILGWRRLDAGSLTRMAFALALGLALNVAILWLADPDLPGRLQRGIEETLAMVPRDPAHELEALLTVQLPKAVITSLRILLWPIVLAAFAFAIGRVVSQRSLGDALAVTFLVVGSLLDTFMKDNRAHRIVLATLIAILLALPALRVVRKPIGRLTDPTTLLIGAVLLVAPFAYSFGTNNQLLPHMGGAAIFPSVLAIAQIRAMWIERRIPAWVLAVSLVLMTALPAEFLVRQWIDGRYTYRLGAPLAAQTAELPRNPGEVELRVAPSLAHGINDYLRLLRDSGFVAGQPMIDFTGQSPGLVALGGGVPLGAIWLIGGPMFRGDETARISLAAVDPAALRRAWLLTSRDSFAAIDTWTEIMRSRIGALTHEETGRVTISDPTSDDKTKTIEVTVWRPKR